MRSFLAFISTLLAVFVGTLSIEASRQVTYSWQSLEGDQAEQEVLVKLGRMEPATNFQPAMVAQTPKEPENPKPIVVWLHISGFRTDYVNKAQPNFLNEAEISGSSSKRYNPVYPTLSWPNLASQATGAPVTDHGIYADNIRDAASGEILSRPTDSALLKAEPIWTTAKSQGIRVLVHDWPFSQTQPAENTADISLSELDPSLSDADRLNKLYDAWASDTGEEKLQLIMGCLFDLEKAAIEHGARDDATVEAIKLLDRNLSEFFEKVRAKMDDPKHREDALHVLLTTDHGMADVKTKIHFESIAGDLLENFDYALNDALALIWFKADADKEAVGAQFDSTLGGQVYSKIYSGFDIPVEWGLGGEAPPDRAVLLQPEYLFTTQKGPEAVYAASETNGPYATSGYLIEATSRMRGQVFYFTFPNWSGQADLGEIDATQFHASVCKLLEIQPSKAANTKTIFGEE